jgi:hypothetical protein
MHIGFWWESQKERGNRVDLTHGWKDDMMLDLRETVWCGMFWNDLATLVNTVMRLWVA